MSYEELRQHAARIEELAALESLKKFGMRFVGGRSIPGEEHVDQLLVKARDRYAGVAAMFDPFLYLPDTSALAAMYDQLFLAAEMLATGSGAITDPVHGRIVRVSSVMNKMERVSQTMGTWQGDAAEVFKATFVEPWPAVTANQFSILSIMAGAIAAEKALWDECRRNVDELAHHAIDALETVHECSPKEQTFALSVVASIFSVGAAAVSVSTGGAGTAVALTLVGSTAAALGDVPREDPPEMRFDAQSVDGLLDQFQAALQRLAEEVNRKEREIADAMTAATESMVRGSAYFVSARPTLADVGRTDLTTKTGLGEYR
jgi:uncharacterized protein YukE